MRLSLGVLVVGVAVLVGVAVVGCGGGDGGSAGGGTSTSGAGTGTGGTSSSTSGTAPALVQMNTYQTANTANENNSTVQFKSVTAAGHAIWVAATVSDYGGIHTISVTDTQGNSYTQLLPQQDEEYPGYQSVAHFYAGNIVGDTSVPDTITVTWGNDDYKGILITEISGTTAAPLVGQSSNLQDSLPAGTNNVTSGSMTVTSAQTPALLVALSMNTNGGTSNIGGNGAAGPAAGSGMTSVATFWDWGGNVNLATFVTATVTGAESVSPVFNAPATDPYVTVAAVFH